MEFVLQLKVEMLVYTRVCLKLTAWHGAALLAPWVITDQRSDTRKTCLAVVVLSFRFAFTPLPFSSIHCSMKGFQVCPHTSRHAVFISTFGSHRSVRQQVGLVSVGASSSSALPAPWKVSPIFTSRVCTLRWRTARDFATIAQLSGQRPSCRPKKKKRPIQTRS